MAVITATQFYAQRKAALLVERGSIGKHDATGNELPRLMYADKISLPAMLVPFVGLTLEGAAYAGAPADGKHVYSMRQAAAGAADASKATTQLLGAFDTGATSVQFTNATVNARPILEWLRLGRARNPEDMAIRSVEIAPGIHFPYYYWARSSSHGALARRLLAEWETVIKEATRPPGAGQVWLTREETQAFLSAYYRACVQCTHTYAMETSTVAEIQEAGQDAVKAGKGALKDAASEIGEMAGDAANVAGDALGRAGAGFLSQIGIIGAIFVIGLIYAKKQGVL